MGRLAELSTNPVLTSFARDTSQAAVRPLARFISPIVEVPDITGHYKIYDAKSRYKRANTKRQPGQPATQIGFTAADATLSMTPRALDFPVPNVKGLSDEQIINYAKYGMTLLSDAAALDQEGDVLDKALATAGAGTDYNFASNAVDPIAILDAAIKATILAARNGAAVKIAFGTSAFINTRHNANVKARFVSGTKNGLITPQLADIQAMLFANPRCELSLMVQDTAAEGQAASMSFMLDNAILVFASNDNPNTMDPSFMKTFVPMGGYLALGEYETPDKRDEVMKIDWTDQVAVTNAGVITRINGNAS